MDGSSASSGSPPPEGATDIHQPFTRAERMLQLSEIDQVCYPYLYTLPCRTR